MENDDRPADIEIYDTDDLVFTINGKIFSLGNNIPLTTTLLDFIRNDARFTGTKSLCHEGGCGVCTVVAKCPDPETGAIKTFSVQSCQTLVYACIGWSILTVEFLGNQRDGLDKLQVALQAFYGTQCGYCTPGFLMTMYGQLQNGQDLNMRQVEKAFDGNLCRCTGYRPIMEAFKCFASDAPLDMTKSLVDIEEAYKTKCCEKNQKSDGKCRKSISLKCSAQTFTPKTKLEVKRGQKIWYRPTSIQEIYDIMKTKLPDDKIRIVLGNTGQGVYKNEGPYKKYININGVEVLNQVEVGRTLRIGANLSLKRCIELFRSVAKNGVGYKHLLDVAKHWEVVANVGVRNVGSWAGNMMMKHQHPEFCSDIFINLVAVDAKLNIGHCDGYSKEMSTEEFMSRNMTDCLILSMDIPTQSENVVFKSYKITPRAVNAHAYVNGCFKFQINSEEKSKLKNTPTIVFGGINPSFIRATKTEEVLKNRSLDDSVIKEAIMSLGEELNPDSNPADASPSYRMSLAQSLLYKALMSVLNPNDSTIIQNPNIAYGRHVSSSKQQFDSNENAWPINKSMPKLESMFQMSGEATYMNDIVALPGELYGAFVQSTIGKGKIQSIDTTHCFKLSGVVDFITASDIPGKNIFYTFPSDKRDPVFADSEINHAGQSIGLVVATSRQIAKEAAGCVQVTYVDVKRPILTIKEAIEEKRYSKTFDFYAQTFEPRQCGDVEDGFKNSKYIVEGEIEFGSQFHFPMEPLAARVVQNEGGYDVCCTTQWPTQAQNTVADNLAISANSVNVSVLRIGGGFGSKISRCHIVSSAAAIAAHKLQNPVRVTLDLSTHMTLVGWREPYYVKYKVGFDEDGRLKSVSADIFCDVGFTSSDENSSAIASYVLPLIYQCPHWRIQPYTVTTDTPSNTWCRAPGFPEGVGIIENIIERIAHCVKKDPLTIRELNFPSKGNSLNFGRKYEEDMLKTKIFPLLRIQAKIEERQAQVSAFNETHQWIKRGISATPLRYPFQYIFGFQYNTHIVVYEHDGTVAIQHGGIEMGQGINTKVAQVAATILDIPMDFIKIKATDVFAGANSAPTSASHGSDLTCLGVKICCERIRDRMNVVREKQDKGNKILNWVAAVKRCFEESIDLCERYFTATKEHPKGYDIWGAACLEVELDVLTGQFIILRADVIEDCGRSLNPSIDVGQVEGAFVMGLGFFTTEKVKYDPATGQKLSNGTWEYKVPSALDIPIDFRVTLLPKGDNEAGVLRSKATGEPAFCLSYAVITALRQAIRSVRENNGNFDWFEIDSPLTVENIYQLCNLDPTKF